MVSGSQCNSAGDNRRRRADVGYHIANRIGSVSSAVGLVVKFSHQGVCASAAEHGGYKEQTHGSHVSHDSAEWQGEADVRQHRDGSGKAQRAPRSQDTVGHIAADNTEHEGTRRVKGYQLRRVGLAQSQPLRFYSIQIIN